MMRVFIFGSLAVLSFFTVAPIYSQIDWIKDFEEAKSIARAEKKLILVDFWARHCEPCRGMDLHLWPEKRIQDLSGNFVMHRVDLHNPNYLQAEYGAFSIPMIVFADCAGNKLLSYSPEMYPHMDAFKDLLISVMRLASIDVSALYETITRLENSPDNLILRIATGDQYRALGLRLKPDLSVNLILERSNHVYKTVSKSKKIKDRPDLQDKAWTSMALNHLDLLNYKKARQTTQKSLKKFPDSPFRPIHLFCMVKTCIWLQDRQQAKRYLFLLEDQFPEHSLTQEASSLLN